MTGLALSFILVAILYYKTLALLVNDWINLPDYSHGFLVPLISLYFVWERRKRLAEPPVPSNWGLLLLASGLILFLFGRYAAEYFTQRISIIFVIGGIVMFLLGKDHLRSIAFPLAFLLLMVPLPSILIQKITFPLQLFVSRCAAESLSVLAVPVLLEGNYIHLPNVTLNVAEACSGIRFMISSVFVGTLFAYFTNKILWQRVLVVLFAVPLAIFANILRVLATAFFSYHYGARVAEGRFHELLGCILFLIAATAFYGLGVFLSRVFPDRK
ncbi:MAG TPA: exosortase A [Syntrophobacteraceae bacterium]|nr:exosortase A [Syntrophobacteraceae bacterium]